MEQKQFLHPEMFFVSFWDTSFLNVTSSANVRISQLTQRWAPHWENGQTQAIAFHSQGHEIHWDTIQTNKIK